MTDPNKRRENWEAKYDVGRVAQMLERKRPAMAARYEAAVAAICTMETKTREVLNTSGVHTTHYVPYLNFARQLYKLTRQREITGESFAMAAQVLLDKWAARDLDPKVLAKIRTGVFDIGEPTKK
jgi:hypothetical protein